MIFTMKQLNVGIVGFGFMGKAHTYAYKTIPLYYDNLPFKINLRWVCNRTLEKAIAAKEQLNFAFATDNIQDLLDDKELDIIDICTPNVYHSEQVMAALQAGKHVYCDKPLAASYEQAQQIVTLAEKQGIITQMALQNRFIPATLRAKELIEEGRLGNILTFRAAYLHSGSVDPAKPIGWKQDKSIRGGGVLFDLGSHVLDLLYHLMGEYKNVYARTRVLYPQRPDKSGKMISITADDAAYMILETKSGAVGTVEASKIATGTNDELRFEIHGDKGAIRFNLMDPSWLEFYDNTLPDSVYGGDKGFTKIECVHRYPKPGGSFPGPKFSPGWLRGHVHSLYNFVNAVYEGKQPSPSFAEGAYIQYVMEKAYQSSESGAQITL